MMSIASLLSIKITSPITHMVSSAVRGVAASLLGLWLFADIISRCVGLPAFYFVELVSFVFTLFSVHSGRVASIATILLGSIYYTWVKHVESQPAKYDRVPLEDVEAGKGPGEKSTKPE